jgi:hypothetical protein
MPPRQKFCGRDYGDRVHWTPAPAWFTVRDCAAFYDPSALWSDLYVACYTTKGGFISGGNNLGAPQPNECHWDSFAPTVK